MSIHSWVNGSIGFKAESSPTLSEYDFLRKVARDYDGHFSCDTGEYATVVEFVDNPCLPWLPEFVDELARLGEAYGVKGLCGSLQIADEDDYDINYLTFDNGAVTWKVMVDGEEELDATGELKHTMIGIAWCVPEQDVER